MLSLFYAAVLSRDIDVGNHSIAMKFSMKQETKTINISMPRELG